jgi:hypothetical protein
MVSALLAALLATTSPTDTVFTVDGGRITGSVLEESPSTGVTIQTPDGALRKIDHAQVSRIEYADGTVSTPQKAQPPPPAPAVKSAAEVPLDTVFVLGGGRARGSVMEESATAGVKLRLPDGTVHAYPVGEVSRIEYADGTFSTPPHAARHSGPPVRRPPEGVTDTVYFVGGGRVRGTVLEENPRTGVKVRQLDGTIQAWRRSEVARIEYADGSVSVVVVAPRPAPAPVPVIAAATVQPKQLPLYVAVGVGATFLDGDASRNVRMSDVFSLQQVHVSGELAFRLSPSWAIGGYGDAGGGDPSGPIRAQCDAAGNDCSAATGRVGFLIRHTWEPLSSRPLWLSLGTGWEVGTITAKPRGESSGSSELLRYTGREYLRVGTGVDFRMNYVVGLGLYGGVGFGEYNTLANSTTKVSLERGTHTTVEVGLRLILFP